MNIIELLREQSLVSLFNVGSFDLAWKNKWKDEVLKIVKSPNPGVSLIDLGDSLREVFRSTSVGSRRSDDESQKSASAAGAAWECLVCWYINACSINSRLVAIRTRSIVPNELREAIQVNYWSSKTNSESDVICLLFPDKTDFIDDASIHAFYRPDGSLIKAKFSRKLSELTIKHLPQFELGIIQLKTNWNENAQIPMLWDLIYNNPIKNITIGTSTYALSDLKKFTYSFITVPTNKLEFFDKNSLSVMRVKNISGGNYWGTKTENHVANSIKEIFNRNFKSAFTTGFKNSVDLNGSNIFIRDCFQLK